MLSSATILPVWLAAHAVSRAARVGWPWSCAFSSLPGTVVSCIACAFPSIRPTRAILSIPDLHHSRGPEDLTLATQFAYNCFRKF